MTVYDLAIKLTGLLAKGYGDEKVYFDTEACQFDFHCAEIDHIQCEDELVGGGVPAITLHFAKDCYNHTSEDCDVSEIDEESSSEIEDYWGQYYELITAYGKQHIYCPECGSDHCTSPFYMRPYIDFDNVEAYVDNNLCICTNCNHRHTKHDRLPLPFYKTGESI